jgi:hypothetical protein
MKNGNTTTTTDSNNGAAEFSTTTASTVADSRSSSAGHCRQVSFDKLIIRRYPMILGDNPACSIGTPVTLDWVYEDEQVCDIDLYECERQSRRPSRGIEKMRLLVLSYYRRRDILRQAGYNDAEIKAAAKQVDKIRRQRTTTTVLMPLGRVQEAVASAGRKIKKSVATLAAAVDKKSKNK